jgi:DNA-binding beta-propeller fold protein YncE
MQIGSGTNTYEWQDTWASIPESDSTRDGWAHHGVTVTEAGQIITYHPGDPTMMVFDPDGALVRTFPVDLSDAHGITVVKEGGRELLWIADNGRKRLPGIGYDYPGGEVRGQVLKMDLEGKILASLEKPDIDVYRDGMYSPTWVAVNEERHGGNGDVWVADGYGQSYVHRYDSSGNYISSINGEEGETGRFNCPHAIFIDRRSSPSELYVADRANGRVQVYDLEGNYKRVFGSDFLTTPSGFVTHGDLLVIAELRARLTLCGKDDEFVCYLGANEEVCNVEGWPNNKDASGNVVATSLLEAGKFNSPHGLAVDAQGNLFVAEWLIGGRFIRLGKV